MAANGGKVGSGGVTDSGAASGGVTTSGGSAGSLGLAGATTVASSTGVTGSAGATSATGFTASGGLTATGGVLASGGSAYTSSPGGSIGTAGAGGTAGTAGAGGLAGSTRTGGSQATSTGGSSGDTGTGGTGGAKGGATATGGTGGGTGGTAACASGPALTGGKQYCSNTKGDAGKGYSYELWAEGSGTGCMTVHGVDAAFSANWNNVEDFLARVGLQFDQTKTPAQIGTISSDFAESKTASSGLVYVGIYGWTVNPLVEYYILEDWGSTKPGDTASDGTPRTKAGTIEVDDETYDVYTHERVNKPAITGDNKTFQQYFSIRRTARSCGHISISEHFSKWIGLGLPLGKLVEAKLLLEAQNGSGTIAFSKATVVVK